MRICVPDFVSVVLAARDLLPELVPARSSPQTAERQLLSGEDVVLSQQAEPWDPIAAPATKPPIARHVSLPPHALPPEWQAALRRMAKGLPQNDVVVSHSIVLRMREKLCQLAWTAQNAGMQAGISTETVDRYLTDLQSRGENGRNGLRWATLRASIEELYRFSRYIGMPEDMQRFLADRLALIARREQAQKALKHFALARTGNTTDSVLEMADALLASVNAFACSKKRHRIRNGACILGLYPIAPLRPASADLIFGTTLFWRNEEWVIDTSIQKTRARNPKPFVMPLHPDHGRFIDAILLGDHTPMLLPQLRKDAMTSKRQLFVLPGGSPAAETYIPRIYKLLTANSLGTSRTMLHTDLGISEGAAGTRRAMIACHQESEQTAQRYTQDMVALNGLLRRQAVGFLRRSEYAIADMHPSLEAVSQHMV